MKLLSIEDDAATAQAIALMLKSEGFTLSQADDGESGLHLGEVFDYDAILLDINLPDMSGFEVLRTLRTRKVATPVIILSGLAGIADKVKGLNLGADDYLVKPFHKDELVARIHAVVRRHGRQATNVITVGRVTIDIAERAVTVDGQHLHLTPKEYDLLELFMLKPGKLISKEAALEHLYGGRDEPDLKIVDVFVCKLRNKLPSPSPIETVWGSGYRFIVPATVE